MNPMMNLALNAAYKEGKAVYLVQIEDEDAYGYYAHQSQSEDRDCNNTMLLISGKHVALVADSLIEAVDCIKLLITDYVDISLDGKQVYTPLTEINAGIDPDDEDEYEEEEIEWTVEMTTWKPGMV